jgi:hypothetical protein
MLTIVGSEATKLGLPARLRVTGDDKFRIMEEWLRSERLYQNRHEDHLELPDDSLGPILPTRVIDVTFNREALNDEVRLIETRPKQGQQHFDDTLNAARGWYIALSYRWGLSPRRFVTTKTNLTKHGEGINMEDLPKTFQDTVTIARRLGVRYIWIDALCIIQDDPDDWAREAAMMGEIYMLSFCTFAAHAANSADEGFLAQALRPAVAIQLGSKNTESTAVDTSESFDISWPRDVNRHLDQSELSNRGWVLQERYLSRRTIHFLDSQLYWETDEGISADDGASFEPHTINYSRNRSIMHWAAGHYGQFDGKPPEGSKGNDSKSAENLDWTSIVQRYSECALTVETDKLVAISGIVRQIHRCTGVKYYAGLWADHFHQHLLWLSRDEPLTPPQSTRVRCRAPSWSWAYWDGPIQYPESCRIDQENQLEPEFEFIEIKEYGVATIDAPIGLLEGDGRLILRSRVKGGLLFVDGRVSKPQEPAFADMRFETLIYSSRIWTVCDKSRNIIGWAALNGFSSAIIDGDSSRISCVRIAGRGEGRASAGIERGYLVVFLIGERMSRHELEKVGLTYNYWRAGMGQIFRKEWFDDASDETISII